jgi:hypothetical protein
MAVKSSLHDEPPGLGSSSKTSTDDKMTGAVADSKNKAPIELLLETWRSAAQKYSAKVVTWALLALLLTSSAVQAGAAPLLPPNSSTIADSVTRNNEGVFAKLPPLGFVGLAPGLSDDLLGLDLNPEETATVRLFNTNKASVVNITNVGLRQNNITLDVEKVPRGTGSGFIWDSKGHIVTNFHVIQVTTSAHYCFMMRPSCVLV